MAASIHGTHVVGDTRLNRKKERATVGKPSDIIILILGPTGVGKSTLIQELTGDEAVVVGHNLESCTHDVAAFEAQIPRDFSSSLAGRRLMLVDTPGFDHEFTDDAEILGRIIFWLERTYGKGMTPAGIVYMSDITQERILSSWRTIDKTLSRLCRENSFSKVVLAGSQWDKLRDESSGLRVQERTAVMCQRLVGRGAKVMHIKRKPDDQHAIIHHLLSKLAQRDVARETVLPGRAHATPYSGAQPGSKASGSKVSGTSRAQQHGLHLYSWLLRWKNRQGPFMQLGPRKMARSASV